jgi:uncharacterized protein YndB with AHSA1/START domain
MTAAFDPRLDLVLERVVDVPRERVWAAWTTPELLKPWFCPKPWSVSECEIDLRPGGRFFTLMNGPNGERMPHDGCYLEVVPQERLVWTDALLAGWRPSASPFVTAILTFAKAGAGTRYRAHVLHADVATREKHEAMGFAQGWGIALDQLVAQIKASK